MAENEEFKFMVTIHPDVRETKPTDEEMVHIPNKMRDVEVSLKMFSGEVNSPNSKTFSPSVYNGTPSNDRRVSQSMIVLDFDNKELKISSDAILGRCNELELNPNIIYESFSSTEELRKYRLIFLLSSPFTLDDADVRDMVVQTMHDIFPEADTTCMNRGRVFFGAKQNLRVLKQEPSDKDDFILKVMCWAIHKDGDRTRLMKKFASNNWATPKPSLIGEISNFYNINNNRSSGFSPKSIEKKNIKKSKWDVSEARKRIKAFDRFMTGEKLLHPELLMIATNLYWKEGGEKIWNKHITSVDSKGNPIYHPSKANIFKCCKKFQYPPIRISSKSLSKEDNGLHCNFNDLLSNQRGKVDVKNKITLIPIQEAEQKLKEIFNDIINTGHPDKIHLVICPTGVGKTEVVKHYNSTIALPTHMLKNEMSSRMDSIEHVCTPDNIIFKSDELNQRINKFYSLGLYSKALEIIHEVAKNSNGMSLDTDDVNIARLYLEQLNDCMSSKSTILTTHARSFNNEFGHDTVIFDEDPLNEISSLKSLSIKEMVSLRDIKYQLDGNSGILNGILNFLNNCETNKVIKTPKYNIDKDELMNELYITGHVESNIFEYLSSEYFIIADTTNDKIITYASKKEFPENKKIVILSATAPEYIYRQLFGDKLNVYRIEDVEQTGQIIQYTGRSCSRDGLKKYADAIEKQLNSIEHDAVITFKKYKRNFTKCDEEVHFGNCSGYDHLKGKNIAVVGTPHMNNAQYFLMAKILGLDWTEEESRMEMQMVEHKGIEFRFHTFTHEGLRSIHLALVEGQLLQAVGRARTVRTVATAHLFSNFPLWIATRYIY